MVGIYEQRRSDSAKWCQRLAIFLIPYFFLIIFLFRLAKITPVQLFALLVIGFMIALLAVVFGIRAITELWSKGYSGGSKVVRGLAIIFFIMIPLIYHVFLALKYPLANDVSTDTLNPPQYLNAEEFRASQEDNGMNQIIGYTKQYSDMIVTAYPKLRPRRYPADQERVLEAVQEIIRANHWRISGTQGIPESGPDLDGDTPAMEESNNEETQEDENTTLEDNDVSPDDIYIEVVERTPVFGFETDLILRIVGENQNTLVDARSSSRWGKHDFGYNARLIESFMSQLDTALLGIAGEG